MDLKKRRKNERKFGSWIENSKGGRIYSFEINGKLGWKARYIKEVDENETILRFFQEIYNDKNELVEVHEKYPVDKGHQKVKRNGSNKK